MAKVSFNGTWRIITKKDDKGYSWEIPTIFPDVENMEAIFKKRNLPFRYNTKGDFVAQIDCVKLAEAVFENEK